MEFVIRVESGTVIGMVWGLALFGVGYNRLVAWMEARGYMEGYTALMVVGGVLVTLGGLALVSWQFALVSVGGFAASGLPMVVGSIARHVQRREAGLRALREDVHDHDAQGMAEQCQGSAQPRE